MRKMQIQSKLLAFAEIIIQNESVNQICGKKTSQLQKYAYLCDEHHINPLYLLPLSRHGIAG